MNLLMIIMNVSVVCSCVMNTSVKMTSRIELASAESMLTVHHDFVVGSLSPKQNEKSCEGRFWFNCTLLLTIATCRLNY